MKKLILLASICLLVHSSLYAQQASNVISYQGLIQGVNGASVKDSTYSVSISMWTNATGGTQLWQDVFQTPVKDGIFNIMLGSQVPLPASADMDRPLWLSVNVGGSSGAVPRSQLSAVPMAMNVADSSITAQKMATDYVSAVTVNGTPVTSRGSTLNFSSGDGVQFSFDSSTNSVYANIPPAPIANDDGGTNWSQIGNRATNPDTNYIGTSDSVALEIHVNNNGDLSVGNGRVMRYEPNAESANIIGGWHGNSVGLASVGAVIAGGGYSGSPNSIAASTDNATISGGDKNTVSALGGTIGGGQNGNVYSVWATIGGGIDNSAGDPSDGENQHQTVGGGNGNIASGDDAAIAGGEMNTATGGHSGIASGFTNYATATGSDVGGGEYNTDTGNHGVIAGGESNTVWGSHSSILGGVRNFVPGGYSSIIGGHDLSLGDSSVGFNGSSTTVLTDLSYHHNTNVGYFGNIDLWIGNVDDSARELRFYSPNHDFTYASSIYSAFKAGNQSGNIVYTLPISVPTVGEVLGAASVSGTDVGLSWVSGSGGSAGWLLTGNAGTNSGTNYLGTNDTAAFEIHIDNLDASTGGNHRVIKYQMGSTSPNIIGGSSANTLGAGLSGAAVLSGGSITNPNVVNDSFSVIAGGDDNKIDTDADHAFIGSGRQNYINGLFSMIGGGEDNIIAADSADHNVITGGLGNIELDPSFGVIAGGAFNYLGWDSWSSSIGGGWNDSIFTNWATIGGGAYNFIDGYCTGSTIAGGDSNRIGAAGYAFIGGGFHNKAWGEYTTIGGGYKDSTFGLYSFLGGGQLNKIDFGSTYSTLAGGYENYISSAYGFLGGGQNNMIASGSDHSVLAGGQSGLHPIRLRNDLRRKSKQHRFGCFFLNCIGRGQ